MARYIDGPIAAAVQAAQGRFGIFFKVAGTDTEPAVCLWSGVQNRIMSDANLLPGQQYIVLEDGRFLGTETGAAFVTGETADSAGDTYIGLGTLLDAPELDHIVDGTATEVKFSLSMLASHLSAYLAADPPKVRGRLVSLGLVAFDQYWQPTTPIIWLAQFTASHLEDSIDPPEAETGPHIGTLRLIAKNGDTSRSRGVAVYWSPQQWGLQHPGNTFTDQVQRYQAGVTAAWPAFSAEG